MNYKNKPEIIIMMGFPGSGKSTYCKENYPTYKIINQDDLGSKEKTLQFANYWLNQGRSIVIDRTNVTKSQRKLWIDLAKDFKLEQPKLIFMDLDLENCYKRICERTNHPVIKNHMTKERKRVIMNKFVQFFEFPDVMEGFKCVSIIDVNSLNNCDNSSTSTDTSKTT